MEVFKAGDVVTLKSDCSFTGSDHNDHTVMTIDSINGSVARCIWSINYNFGECDIQLTSLMHYKEKELNMINSLKERV